MKHLGARAESRARDGLVNDNFTAFVVVAKDETFKEDTSEITTAHWFNWRELLSMCAALCCP